MSALGELICLPLAALANVHLAALRAKEITRLELGPQQKNIFFAWFVENKGNPKSKRETSSGEDKLILPTQRLDVFGALKQPGFDLRGV